MKNLIVLSASALVLLFSASVFSDTFVQGYFKKDGTYVAPHYRSSPDKSYNNNWSVKPNINLYTGKQGTRNSTYNDRYPYSNSRRGNSGLYDSYNKYNHYGY